MAKKRPQQAQVTVSNPEQDEAPTSSDVMLLRGVPPEFLRLLDDKRSHVSRNRATTVILGNLAKHPSLFATLLHGDFAKTDLEKFSEVLSLLSWAEHAFAQRSQVESGWAFDCYRRLLRLLSRPDFSEFAGVAQLCRYRCGFICMDRGLAFELQGIVSSSDTDFERADHSICMAIGFHNVYFANTLTKDQEERLLVPVDWTPEKLYYNQSCAWSQRARNRVHRELVARGRVKPQSLLTNDGGYRAAWEKLKLGVSWRDWVADKAVASQVDEYASQALDSFRAMFMGKHSLHVHAWLKEAGSDPDLLFLQLDSKFGPLFNAFELVRYGGRDVDSVATTHDELWELIQSENPDVASEVAKIWSSRNR